MSKAALIRNRAFKLAQEDNPNLLSKVDLPGRAARYLASVVDPAAGASRTLSMLLVGCCTPGLLDRLEGEGVLAKSRIHAIARHDSMPEEGSERPSVRRVQGDLADYSLDPGQVAQAIEGHSLNGYADYLDIQAEVARLRAESPLIGDGAVDVLVQDFTANLMAPERFGAALAESFRALSNEGTLTVMALVADEALAEGREVDWGKAGKLTYFPQETALLGMLEAAGFHGLSLQLLADMPVVVLDGRELRAVAVSAYKGTAGSCLDQGHAVIYRGPWRAVVDDDGHTYRRGERAAVCAKTYGVLQRAPYRGEFIGLPAAEPPSLKNAPVFDCDTPSRRVPRVTKGQRPVGSEKSVPALQGFVDDGAEGACCEPGDGGGGCC